MHDIVKTTKSLLRFDESRKGEKVRLLRTTDPYTGVRPGMIGTVDFVDDTGTVHCTWENGACLGLIPGMDQWEWIADE